MPILAVNKDGTVKIARASGADVRVVKPEELGQYSPSLVKEYATYQDSLTKISGEDTKKKDAKADFLKKAESVLDIIGKGKSGSLKGKEYEDAINSVASQYVASKAFGEGGKSLTNTELSILSGQTPVIEQRVGNPLEKAAAWAQGRVVPQRGVVTDDPATLERKMLMAVAALKGEQVDPKALQAVAPPQKEEKPTAQGFGGNLANNAKDILNSILNFPKQAAEQVGKDFKIQTQGANPLNPVGIQLVSPETAKNAAQSVAGEYNDLLGRPLEGGDIIDKILKRGYEKPANTILDLLPFLPGKGGPLKGANRTPDSPNLLQKGLRSGVDAVQGAGSKEYVARQGADRAIPQNQVLLDEGIVGRPTTTGKIQATSQALEKYGSQIGDAFKQSDRVFKGDELGKTLDSQLKGQGYDAKSIDFIKKYVNTQGEFDLASGDNLIPTEKAWNAAKMLEKNPPKMLKNPESGAAYKRLAGDAARIIRGRLAEKVPEIKGLNERYSALRDYMDNVLPEQSSGLVDTERASLVKTPARALQNLLTGGMQAAYQPPKFLRDMRHKQGNFQTRK